MQLVENKKGSVISEEENYRKDMETWFASVPEADRRQKLIDIQVAARFSKPIDISIIQPLQDLASKDYSADTSM